MVDAYADGVLRVLALAPTLAESPPARWAIDIRDWRRRPRPRHGVGVAEGFFLADVGAGTEVAAGQRLGR